MHNHVFSLPRNSWLRRTLTLVAVVTAGPFGALGAERMVLVEHFTDTG